MGHAFEKSNARAGSGDGDGLEGKLNACRDGA
jgi:hypothetical protein